MADSCVHEMPFDQCGDCTPPPKMEVSCTEGQDGPTIDALGYSDCASCGDRLVPGDRITHIDLGWVHADSASTEGAPPPTSADIFGGI